MRARGPEKRTGTVAGTEKKLDQSQSFHTATYSSKEANKWTFLKDVREEKGMDLGRRGGRRGLRRIRGRKIYPKSEYNL